MDELKAVATFVRAAELGSFNKVAEIQGSTPQAVSKRIRQLEMHLRVRLFHRTTRKISLTEEGERLLESVRPNLDGLVQALSRARSAASDDHGLIRICAPGVVGRQVLVPLITGFQAEHPLIRIELLLDDRFTDLVAERIDLGFRGGSAPDTQMVVRRLFPIQQIPCASPAYLLEHGVPASIQELGSHRLTGYRHPGAGRPMPWEFLVGGDIVYHSMPAAFFSNDPEAEMLAVIDGAGIGLLDSVSAASAIRAGRLVPLLTRHVSDRMGLYLYYPQRSAMPGRVRHFVDFAMERLKNHDRFYLPAAELQARAQAFEALRGAGSRVVDPPD